MPGRIKTDFGKSAGLPEGGGANRVNLYNLLDPILSDRRESFYYLLFQYNLSV